MPAASVDPSLLQNVRSVEWRTRRILGAVRFEDRTTGETVSKGLQVCIPGVKVLWNHSGYLVLCRATGLEFHTEAFRTVPETPISQSLSFAGTVKDLSGCYLSRSFTLRLPRNSDPTRHELSESLFQPVVISLFPASSARTFHPLWSQVRVSLSYTVHGEIEPLSGALLRVTDALGSSLFASGLTDRRGEGIVFIPGIPPARPAEGENGNEEEPVVVYELPARLQVVWRSLEVDPPDPDRLEAERESLVRFDEPLFLKAGRTEKIRRILTVI